jgi:glycosyltransferase involved in cell wall biosynthesis
MGAMSLGMLTTLAQAGIPLVLVVCDDWLCYGPDLDPWTRMFRHRPGLAALARRVTAVPAGLPHMGDRATFCFISDFIRRRALEHGSVPVRDSTIVYSGIDTVDFPIATPPAVARPWQGELLYAGRVEVRKGVETLLRALAHLPATSRLTFDGRGEAGYLEHLRALARELGVDERVSFTVSTRAELAARYAAADVLVFPVEWEEPFGLVPVEAMACATPVVATGTGGSGEFLRDGDNCVLVTPGDEAGLVAAIKRLEGDDDLRQRVIAGGLRTASELTIDRLADVLEEWHAGAATGFSTGRPQERRLRL